MCPGDCGLFRSCVDYAAILPLSFSLSLSLCVCVTVCVFVRARVSVLFALSVGLVYNDETTLYVIPSTKTEVSECEGVSVIYCKAWCRMHVLPYKGHILMMVKCCLMSSDVTS